MTVAAQAQGLSAEEYLVFERSAEERHEYADGEIFAMSGGTLEHSLIATNISRHFGNALRGRGCRVLNSDMRVKISVSERYLYPDVSVVCDRPAFEDDRRDNLLNPSLIVEVLSPTSEAYDRGDKFAHYRLLPSLQVYVLAAQDEPRIEIFRKQADDSWNMRVYRTGDTIRFDTLDCSLAVDNLYEDVFEVS